MKQHQMISLVLIGKPCTYVNQVKSISICSLYMFPSLAMHAVYYSRVLNRLYS